MNNIKTAAYNAIDAVLNWNFNSVVELENLYRVVNQTVNVYERDLHKRDEKFSDEADEWEQKIQALNNMVCWLPEQAPKQPHPAILGIDKIGRILTTNYYEDYDTIYTILNTEEEFQKHIQKSFEENQNDYLIGRSY